ncbi:MAG: hypothetical protein QOH06_3461 [Acidobacteriota bacterium]|jgi:hypothetical protein|nr:hypothetical protein [Acidobacteriota bacterium]
MRKSLILGSVLLALAACQPTAEEPEPAAAASDQPAAASEPAAVPASDTPAATVSEPAPAAPPGAIPAAAGTVLASQETNWKGVVAEVTEFRRKGNTLTAKVRLRNQGSEKIQPEVNYKEVYLMDLGAGKKYEVLQDEKGAYIAGLKSGWNDRWYGELAPGESYTIWVKFPAPPAEVKSVTLQVPGVPPFEDLAIQDS